MSEANTTPKTEKTVARRILEGGLIGLATLAAGLHGAKAETTGRMTSGQIVALINAENAVATTVHRLYDTVAQRGTGVGPKDATALNTLQIEEQNVLRIMEISGVAAPTVAAQFLISNEYAGLYATVTNGPGFTPGSQGPVNAQLDKIAKSYQAISAGTYSIAPLRPVGEMAADNAEMMGNLSLSLR